MLKKIKISMKIRKMKKTVTAVAIVALLQTFILVSPVLAATNYQYITMADSNDFTIVKQGLVGMEDVTVCGLDYAQTDPKVAFTSDEEQYITWTSSNPSRVLLMNPDTLDVGSTITGTDTVRVITVLRGDAVVTATYDTPDAPATSVTSFVVTEGLTTINSVSNIDFTYNGESTSDYTMNGITVPLFNAGAAMNLSALDSADILKQTPSALHALLYTLEIQNSSEELTTPIANFDWDWVRANVTLQSQGSYVYSIGTDVEYYDYDTWIFYGWQFNINTVDPGHGASATKLVNNNDVNWFYGEFIF